MNPRIYLDNNATTAIDPRVIQVMTDALQHLPGNPSSIHSFGQEARHALNRSRKLIADFLQVKPSEILFTSSGTEGLNMMIRGALAQGGHAISSSVEHAAVYETLKSCPNTDVSFLEPGPWGAIQPEAVHSAISSNTRLIALMAANNESGVKTDIARMAAIAKEHRIPLLVDGVALLGKEQMYQIPDGVAAMSFSGHKIHAPKGVGFLYVRHLGLLKPLITGGEQEFGKRAGTENIPGIVGLAEAVCLLAKELPQATVRMEKLRDRLEKGLFDALEGIFIQGQGPRIANTSNIAFEGVEGETLITRLDLEGIAVSHGSACASGALQPSRVLLNMGLSKKLAASALRFSLSRFTTEAEIDRCLDVLIHLVKRLRKVC